MQGVGPTARAYRTGGFTCTAGSFVKLPLDTVDTADDVAGYFDVTTNHRYNVPGPGTFRCSWVATAVASADAQGTYCDLFRGNGVGAAARETAGSLAQGYAALALMPSVGTMDVVCVAGDWLELWIFCSSARAINPGKVYNSLSVQQIA